MQYTGLSEYSEGDPATFVTVGESDGIADWRVMKRRLDGMSALGIDTEFHSYPGLGHGFGLGTGTVAEGWMRRDRYLTVRQRSKRKGWKQQTKQKRMTREENLKIFRGCCERII